MKGGIREMKKIAIVGCVALALCFLIASVSCAADNDSAKQFVKKIAKYPGKALEGTAGTVGTAVKSTTDATVGGVQAVGQTATGKLDKSPDIVNKPLVGTAEAGVKAVEDEGKALVDAAKAEPAATEKK